jgi:hypothetical protein
MCAWQVGQQVMENEDGVLRHCAIVDAQEVGCYVTALFCLVR